MERAGVIAAGRRGPSRALPSLASIGIETETEKTALGEIESRGGVRRSMKPSGYRFDPFAVDRLGHLGRQPCGKVLVHSSFYVSGKSCCVTGLVPSTRDDGEESDVVVCTLDLDSRGDGVQPTLQLARRVPRCASVSTGPATDLFRRDIGAAMGDRILYVAQKVRSSSRSGGRDGSTELVCVRAMAGPSCIRTAWCSPPTDAGCSGGQALQLLDEGSLNRLLDTPARLSLRGYMPVVAMSPTSDAVDPASL